MRHPQSVSPTTRRAGSARALAGRAGRGRRPRTWLWLSLAAIALLAAGALVAAPWGGDQPKGTLAAEHTSHDFGQVRMGDGVITNRFPLTVQDPVLITHVGTS